MAGKGRKVWTGETLSAPDLQDYIQDQTVMAFPNAAARTAAIPAPTEGMHCTLDDTDLTYRYNSSGWVPVQGRTDAGWTNLGLVSGWGVGADGARYRVMSGVCYVQVHAVRSSWPTGTLLLTLPAGLAPAHTHWPAAIAPAGGETKVLANGQVIAQTAGSGVWVFSGNWPIG